MADEAGLYEALWRPEEWLQVSQDLIHPLAWGLAELVRSPEKYKQFNPENGWGSYEGLVRFVEGVLTSL